MTEENKMTAFGTPVGADEKQSSINSNSTLTDYDSFGNDEFEDVFANWEEICDPNRLNTVTMAELYETAYPPRSPIIENLLYPGTYLFAGAPKVGKSFLVAQIGYHASAGIPLWNVPVRQGRVLYLALEDDYARLQGRLSRMFGVEGNAHFHFTIDAHRMADGLDQQLENFIRKHPDTRLIIIDTLQKIREIGDEKYSYSSDYDIIGKLKGFSDRFGICILLVHHTRKQDAKDRMDMISGTTGLLGAADGAFLLHKENRTSNNAALEIVGRDQQDQRLQLNFDREQCTWGLTGIETDLWKAPPDPLLEEIAKILSPEKPAWQGSPSTLAELINTDLHPNVLSRRLNVNAGRLYNEYGIRYLYNRCHEGRKIKLWLESASA